MDFVSDHELLNSPVVANSIMNRSRALKGVNSYERDLKFDISQFILNRIKHNGAVNWCDICCGEAKALLAMYDILCAGYSGKNIELFGIDLVVNKAYDLSTDKIHLCITEGNVMEYPLPFKAELITCVHGLHYIGDKLGLLQRLYADLEIQGVLIAHIDPDNLKLPMDWKALLRSIRKNGVDIVYKNHIITITKNDRDFIHGLVYKGATISETPNYTGIIAVDSCYEQ